MLMIGQSYPGVGDGQGGLACCDLWGRKESDTIERLNWTKLILLKARMLAMPFTDYIYEYSKVYL